MFFTSILAECLKLSLVKCDGGQKDEGHRPDAVLTNLPNTSSSTRERRNEGGSENGVSGRVETKGKGMWRKRRREREMRVAAGERKKIRGRGGNK